MTFDEKEKKLMQKCIEARIANHEPTSTWYFALGSIISELSCPFPLLQKKQKSTLISCIMEHAIGSDEHLLGMSRFEVIKRFQANEKKYERLDCAVNLLIKLKSKIHFGRPTFKSIIDDARLLSESHTIYYSASGNDVYKVGFPIGKKKGVIIQVKSLGCPDLSQGYLDRNSFKSECSRKELKTLLMSISEDKLTENHRMLLFLLGFAIRDKTSIEN